MKKNITSLISLRRLFLLSLCGLCCFACSDMNELSDRFLDREETLYAEKVDSAGANTGFKRIEIRVYVESQRIDFVRVYFTRNAKADSVDIQVGNVSGVFGRIIEDMPAFEYLFSLVSFDKYGNRSLPYELSGRVVGDDYVNGLQNRAIQSVFLIDDGKLHINWGIAPENSLYSELLYTDSEGHEGILHISNDETLTVMESQTGLRSRTVILPPLTIDTFYLEWKNAPVVEESTPFNGPHILSAAAPCIMDARDFDYGGEGLAFHDVSGRSPNSSYRTDAGDQKSAAVDIESGGNLGYVGVGEWLVHTVEVHDAGVYAADVRLSANNSAGASFSFSIDGNTGETVTAPNQSSWNSWVWVFETYADLKPKQPTFRLSEGKHKFRFNVVGGGFNLIQYKLTRTGD